MISLNTRAARSKGSLFAGGHRLSASTSKSQSRGPPRFVDDQVISRFKRLVVTASARIDPAQRRVMQEARFERTPARARFSSALNRADAGMRAADMKANGNWFRVLELLVTWSSSSQQRLAQGLFRLCYQRYDKSALTDKALNFRRIPRHQLVRMHPARQRLDAIEPARDILGCRDVEAEFLGRIIQIGAEREIGDGRPLAEDEGRPRAACRGSRDWRRCGP